MQRVLLTDRGKYAIVKQRARLSVRRIVHFAFVALGRCSEDDIS